MARMEVKRSEGLLDATDAESLKADLICKVRRNVLNFIQADEETPWAMVKERLKKAYGGGRWTPEEDLFQLFRQSRHPRQSSGQYAGELLARFNKATEKMRETASAQEVEGKMAFVASILKVQLAREAGKREGLPRDKSFIECAQELMDSSAREEEGRTEREDYGWRREGRTEREDQGWRMVSHRKPTRSPWRREPDVRASDHRRSEPRTRHNQKSRREERKCHGCGKPGHLKAQCPRTKCFECGTEGHIARYCPYIFRRKDTSRGEPMEVNKVWRRTSGASRSAATSETSDTERGEEEPGSSDDEGVRSRGRRSSQRRAVKPVRPTA